MVQALILGIRTILQEIKRITRCLAASSNGVQQLGFECVVSQVTKQSYHFILCILLWCTSAISTAFFAPCRLVKEYSSTELACVLLIIYGLTACFHPRLIRPWHFSSQFDVPHPDAKGVLLHRVVIHSVTHEHVHVVFGHLSSVQMASTGHKNHPGAHILNKALRLISSCLTKLTKCLFPATEIMHLNVKKIKCMCCTKAPHISG